MDIDIKHTWTQTFHDSASICHSMVVWYNEGDFRRVYVGNRLLYDGLPVPLLFKIMLEAVAEILNLP